MTFAKLGGGQGWAPAQTLNKSENYTGSSNLFRSASLPKVVCSPSDLVGNKPNNSSDFSLELWTPDRYSRLIFSKRSISLRSSGPPRFGTVLEIRTFQVAYELRGKRFCGFSWTGEGVRFPIRHLEVRILLPQPSSPASGDFTLGNAKKPLQWRAFANW